MSSIDTLASPGTSSRPSRAGCLLGDRTRSDQQAPVTVAPARERARRSPRSALSLWYETSTNCPPPNYCPIAMGRLQSTAADAPSACSVRGRPIARKHRSNHQKPRTHQPGPGLEDVVADVTDLLDSPACKPRGHSKGSSSQTCNALHAGLGLPPSICKNRHATRSTQGSASRLRFARTDMPLQALTCLLARP